MGMAKPRPASVRSRPMSASWDVGAARRRLCSCSGCRHPPAHAAKHVGDRRARFEVADARSRPFADASFDVVASGLVLNIVPEPKAAVMEMRRILRPCGIIAAYVWD